jgi:hypothetical protein
MYRGADGGGAADLTNGASVAAWAARWRPNRWRDLNPLTPMHWKIEILENHSGEIGEAIPHADHLFESEEYHYEQGKVLEVAVHKTDNAHWHIFTDLDSGHRFKIPPEKYRKLD